MEVCWEIVVCNLSFEWLLCLWNKTVSRPLSAYHRRNKESNRWAPKKKDSMIVSLYEQFLFRDLNSLTTDFTVTFFYIVYAKPHATNEKKIVYPKVHEILWKYTNVCSKKSSKDPAPKGKLQVYVNLRSEEKSQKKRLQFSIQKNAWSL